MARTKSPKRDWWVVLVTAILGVGVLIVTNNIAGSPVEATIVENTASSAGDGTVDVEITWAFRSTPDQVESAVVRIPESQLEGGVVPVWPDGEGGFTLEDPGYVLVAGDYLLAAGLGALLGVVMVMTVRGYGYVRGTGDPGSQPQLDVAEDRGFYWRT
jgi:hypothetical protein